MSGGCPEAGMSETTPAGLGKLLEKGILLTVATPRLVDKAHSGRADVRGRSRVKPFLRWAGSKRKQLMRLSAFWSDSHTGYVEPFAGSACLFFALAPDKAVLGD